VIPGYSLFRQDRTSSGGGVATYVKDNRAPSQLAAMQERYAEGGLEVTLVKLAMGKPIKNIVLVRVYRQPSATTTCFQMFDELLSNFATCPLMVLGDLNANLMSTVAVPANQLRQSLALAGLKVALIWHN